MLSVARKASRWVGADCREYFSHFNFCSIVSSLSRRCKTKITIIIIIITIGKPHSTPAKPYFSLARPLRNPGGRLSTFITQSGYLGSHIFNFVDLWETAFDFLETKFSICLGLGNPFRPLVNHIFNLQFNDRAQPLVRFLYEDDFQI